MKVTFKNVLLVAVILLTVIQCKKKNDDPEEQPASTTSAPAPNPGTSATPIEQLFNTGGVQPIANTVPASAPISFTVSGLNIEIPANAFLTQSNGPVTGNVSLELKPVLSKRDIILSGAPANAGNDNLIKTKGCVKVSASQNGQTLRLAPSQNFYINVEETGTPEMNVRKYIAKKVSVSDSTIHWKADPDSANLASYLDTLSGKYYYKARIDSANWLNVGKKWDTLAPKTSVMVSADTIFNKTNTAMYISFDNSMIIGALYEVTPSKFRIRNIPIGRSVHIVAIANISGQYYMAILPTTVTLGFNQNISLTPVTLSQLQSQLNTLP